MLNTIEEVSLWVAKHHSGQTRKKNESKIALPYYFHPIEVTKRVYDWGHSDLDVLFAALGHDLLEDTEVTEEEVKEMLGMPAFHLIKELTHNDPYESKQDYLKSFYKKSTTALRIKMADRYCNIYDFAQNDLVYAKIYAEKAEPLFQVYSESPLRNNNKINHDYKELLSSYFNGYGLAQKYFSR